MVGNIFGGILGKVVENAEGILDKVITTDKVYNKAIDDMIKDKDR